MMKMDKHLRIENDEKVDKMHWKIQDIMSFLLLQSTQSKMHTIITTMTTTTTTGETYECGPEEEQIASVVMGCQGSRGTISQGLDRHWRTDRSSCN